MCPSKLVAAHTGTCWLARLGILGKQPGTLWAKHWVPCSPRSPGVAGGEAAQAASGTPIWGQSLSSLNLHDTELTVFLFLWEMTAQQLEGPVGSANEFCVDHLACILSQTIPNMSCKLPKYLCSLHFQWGSHKRKPGSYILFVSYPVRVLVQVLWNRMTCVRESGEGVGEGGSAVRVSECGSAGRRGEGIMSKPFKPLSVLVS